ncbi:hypothetical protein NL676_000743 [Syzygium grande]|nr:hypothetical protein NL676_000743 [Syzygium grande]
MAAVSPSRMALGNSSYNDNTSIYAVAQCIVTVEDSGCSACLQDLAGRIPASCPGKQGLRMLALSCSLKYEIYPIPLYYFPSPRQPTPHPPPSPSRGRHGSDSKTIIVAVVIPGAAAVAVLSILFSYFIWRRYSTILLDSGHDDHDSSESIASLFISLRTLRAATDNFNNDHKLGQGGFGSVYKAWYHWNNGATSKILDPTLGNNWPRDEVLKCIKIGLLCVQEHVADRPSMSEVIMMLSNYNATPPALTRPAYNDT